MDSSEEEVDDATQQVYWKVEAINIRAMKARQVIPRHELVQHTLQEYAALGRPEPVSEGLVLERIANLVKREWFRLDGNDAYVLADVTSL